LMNLRRLIRGNARTCARFQHNPRPKARVIVADVRRELPRKVC
jgi:hypothetical protein